MEWLESMSRMAQDKQDGDEDMVDEEDFYGHGQGANAAAATSLPDALPGAAQFDGGMKPNAISTLSNPNLGGAGHVNQTAEQRKLENQRKAEQLRAKLIANRQNTPNRANTPNKLIKTCETPQQNPAAKMVDDTPAPIGRQTEKKSESSGDIYGIEKLLQEGRAAAEAKAKAEDRAKATVEESAKMDTPPVSQPVQPLQPEPVAGQTQPSQKLENVNTQPPHQLNQVTDLATEYYTDLAIWLEVTGYHDIDYRNSKLRTYKQRKSLEEEAARIQEKLEMLKQTELAEMNALRSGSVHPVATPRRPPALPTTLPAADVAKSATKKPGTNGIKRAHSPEPMLAGKNPRHHEDANNGIRIRGANDSPQDRPYANGRGRAASPFGRRVSYPDARRQDSFGEPKGRASRDPSLERRQAYYARDGEGGRGRERFDSSYPPRENAREGPGRGRMGFSAVNVPQERAYRESYGAAPRAIRDVDTGRGANVKYFMIKSWNAENVAAAMRDSLWSTQEKNEHLLADAYHSSAAVVLCFSVNNSKAFQGYALMTSPPDPLLPKPAFCSKLNWPTSPAFTLQWLATASVHFRYVGHIKNELNLDDLGHPSAVLVGKDGQEIAPEAGRGLCEILDDVMAGDGGSVVDGGGAGAGGGRKGGAKGRAW